MEQSLRKSSLYAGSLLAAIALLVGTVVFSLYNQRRAAEGTELVNHAHSVLGGLFELNALLNSVETEQRGYIVTGDEDYLASFDAAQRDIAEQFEKLHRLIAGDEGMRRKIAEVEAMTEVKVGELKRAVETRATKGFNAAQVIEKSDFGKYIMAEIRSEVSAMIVEGRIALDAQHFRHAASVRRLNWAIMSGGVVAVGVGCFGAFLLSLSLRGARRAERLQRQKRKAERADLEKSRFLANMSHEIRTPMNAILGFGELLDGVVTGEKAKRYVEAIRSSGESLLSLINDILDLSKVEAGQLELRPEPTDLRRVTDSMRTLFGQSAQKKGVRLTLTVADDVPPEVIVDELRLRQIFMNLLSNAIKFTSEGEVSLRLSCTPDEDDGSMEIVGEVRDTGCGLSEGDKRRIFEPFTQAEANPGSVQQGTGLGLSICRRLADLMGGTISVESEPEKGSIFRLRLPHVAVSGRKPFAHNNEDSEEGVAELSHLKPSKIVVADDNAMNRELVAELFEGSGHQLLFAVDGREAVDLTLAEMPDVVLMDVRMPSMDGKAARRAIGRKVETADIPVIAITASSMLTEEKKLRKLFDGFIRKPFTRQDMFKELSRFLITTGSTEATRREPDLDESISVLHPEDDPDRWNDLVPGLHALANEVGEARRVMAVQRIGELAAKLKTMGQSHKCHAVEDYGARLEEQAGAFDLAGMESSLYGFEELVSGLSDAVNKGDKT